MHNIGKLRSNKLFCLPPDIVVVVARAAGLPQPSTNHLSGRTSEVLWNGPLSTDLVVHFGISFFCRPCINARVAGHEMVVPVTLCTLKVCPIYIFTNVVIASNHEPRLSTMICSYGEMHGDVLTWSNDRHCHFSNIIPLLPCCQSLRASCFLVSARVACTVLHVACGVAPIACLRLIAQRVWHASHIVMHCHLVFAHWVVDPPMAKCLVNQAC